MFRFVLALIVLALVSATAQATGLRSENEQLTAAAKVSEKNPSDCLACAWALAWACTLAWGLPGAQARPGPGLAPPFNPFNRTPARASPF